jgi:shikimate dehydrogenase
MDEAQVMPCMNHLLAEKRNIVLIGMPTCGKSAISRQLARKLGREQIEMDAEIEKKLGTTIAECFETHGEEYFRDIETAVAKAIPASGVVVSCGGGVIKRKENMRALSRNSIVIWIDRDIERLFASNDRPLSSSKAAVRKLYDERRHLYEAYSDVRIKNNGTLQSAVNRILRVLEHGSAS